MIVFSNAGTLDLRSITTFGLSSKAGQDKIGRFGTGLKYATAVIVRNGGSMSLCVDGEPHKITARQDNFRDTEFQQITMDGNDLPFTADLGKDWEVWQAFRELYSNALDEGGTVEHHETVPDAADGRTIITVELDAFEAIFFSMEEHFIGREDTPIWECDGLQVFPGRSLFVFYNGIAVQKLKEPSVFRYNLTGYIDLTEDRTAKYSWQTENRIAACLLGCNDPEITGKVCDQRNDFEARLDYSDTGKSPSEVFMGSAVQLGVNSNPTATAIVRAQLPEDGSMATVIQKGTPGAETLNYALSALRSTGADLGKAKFVLADGVQVFGSHDVRGDAIFISESVFDDQDRMTIAVFEGYAGVVGGSWLARSLIHAVTKAEAAQ